MELNADCLQALRARIDAAFAEVHVEYNVYPVIKTMHLFYAAHETMSRGAQKTLEEFVGEWPLLIVAYSCLADALVEKFEYDKNATQQHLSQLLDRNEIATVAASVVSTIEQMPLHYEIAIPLKSSQIRQLLFDQQNTMRITDRIRFYCVDDASVRDGRPGATVASDPLAVMTGVAPRRNAHCTYFSCRVSGYVPRHFATAPVTRGVRLLREILGLGVAIGILEVERVASIGSVFRDQIQVYSHIDGQVAWTADIPCDDATATLIGSVRAHPDALKLQGRERTAFLNRFVDGTSALCQEGDGAARLRRGSSWYLDSRLNPEQILAFIQAVTCLEVVLGDKAECERVGIGTLLSNRCAYMVALSAGDRARVLADFKRVYEKRSRVLHSGHDQLSGRDSSLLSDAHFLCRRTLNAELRLLVNEHLPYNDLWR